MSTADDRIKYGPHRLTSSAAPMLTDREIGDWLVDTVIVFGGQPSTAYKVAGLFLEGINQPNDIGEC